MGSRQMPAGGFPSRGLLEDSRSLLNGQIGSWCVRGLTTPCSDLVGGKPADALPGPHAATPRHMPLRLPQ